MNPHLQINHVTKRYGHIVALDGLSLEVPAGQIVAIIGPSGSGKSTLIRCVHMLDEYDSGSIFLGGAQLGYQERDGALRPRTKSDVAKQRARMGMVFQQFNLFPHRTVSQNVAEPAMLIRGVAKKDAHAEARRLLELVNLHGKDDRYPRQLSGGQQQRVAIARTLAMQPELLLFDEPTSALDRETVGEVLKVMRDVAALGATMVVVTHEIEFARDVANRIIFMENGRIVEDGTPDEILGNPTERMRAFLR